jgi:predicted anti-sigma-YlaC factor YlaD
MVAAKNAGKSCWEQKTIVVKVLWVCVSVAAVILIIVSWGKVKNGFYQYYVSVFSGTILLCSVAFALVANVVVIMMMFAVRCILKPAALIYSLLEGIVSFGLVFYF